MSEPDITPFFQAKISNTNPAVQERKRKNIQDTSQLKVPHPWVIVPGPHNVPTATISATKPAIHPTAINKSQKVSIARIRRDVQFLPNQGVTYIPTRNADTMGLTMA